MAQNVGKITCGLHNTKKKEAPTRRAWGHRKSTKKVRNKSTTSLKTLQKIQKRIFLALESPNLIADSNSVENPELKSIFKSEFG